MISELILNNKEEMRQFARDIAKASKKGDVIGLKGTLGAGKSFFAQQFINALCDEEIDVPSPTFNLVYNYSTNSGEIYHFDLYRLKDENELYNIGIEDALINGISLIEWPEIAQNFLGKNYKEIEIKIGKSEEQRIVTLKTNL
ncbi:MAG: tRNA (adenosine(37)-N6)-threonylcarbamoyltransferase complex ATPase subunit type 1 TsaE [Proteobacteria bacterium]|nr:tRNA (adenosine(37)-N6)-threonylcarbamoyltransferase complex ATPase subunit type 1 TsaE [Pseudomonadota bacterium]